MFESVMPYRREAATLLSQQISSDSFPQAVLFAGSRYSGRLTLAMESARVLSCSNTGEANCACRSCIDFSWYAMDNVIAVGNRDHVTRIDAHLAEFLRLGTQESHKRLVRALRLMLLQYHGALLGSTESKNSSTFNAAAYLDEFLLSSDDIDRPEGRKEYVRQLTDLLKPLQSSRSRSGALSIAQVRALQEWTMQTSFGRQNRFILLEGVEQSTEGARNSLLKMLEEPPAHTYLFLLSEQPSRLLATILSRVQRHHVSPYSEGEKNRLLADLFFIDGAEHPSVEEYFLSRAGIPCEKIRSLAKRYAQASGAREAIGREELDVMCTELDEPVRLGYFLSEFQRSVREMFLCGTLAESRAARLVSVAGEAEMKASVYNQSGRLMVETLHYRLLEES